MKSYPKSDRFHGQKQPYPARQSEMRPEPDTSFSEYKPAGKLAGKTALITGADSGIGRAVALAFALEGADVAILYNENDADAAETKSRNGRTGRAALRSDQGWMCVKSAVVPGTRWSAPSRSYGKARHFGQQCRLPDGAEESSRTSPKSSCVARFETNIFGYFFMAQAALPHLKEGAAIINTGSYRWADRHPDPDRLFVHQRAPFTPSPSRWRLILDERGIRVNCVVPGPVWTPNIPATMPIEQVENFGHEVALGQTGTAGGTGACLRAPCLIRRQLHDRSAGRGDRRATVERIVKDGTRTSRGAPLKPGAIEVVIETTRVSDATRDALRARLKWRRRTPSALGEEASATLRAVCDRLIPQGDTGEIVDLTGRLDARLAAGPGDGWRYDVLPPDREAITLGLRGIEQTAAAMFRRTFTRLPPEWRDAVLEKVQAGSAPGEVWTTMPSRRFFEELLGQLATLYYAHPAAQETIGFIGMADVEGFQAIGLNRRDPIEDMASDAPL